MRMKKLSALLLSVLMLCRIVPASDFISAEKQEAEGDMSRAAQIMEAMTTEQKIAQMLMPAIRAWEGEGVTELSGLPALAEALRRHQYGGLTLFGSNIEDTEQTVRLINDLQANNALSIDAQDTEIIPYLIAADVEGGSVNRLIMGTRGTGSMAIGASWEKAEENARATGQVLGEEMAALGINVNLGPCIDVITDPADQGMSTRVFSDDPETASKLGQAFGEGVGESNVITCYKHFPGAGDGSDYPTSIWLSPEDLESGGLLAYRRVIDNGAEMLMTSAATFPLIDEEMLMGDGKTKGFYPATLSPLFVTRMLREELGFDGVVITDALEMDQFISEPDNGTDLFSGEAWTVEHDLQVAEKAINAGCDILLISTDLNDNEAAEYYEEYISGLVQLAENGSIAESRIDESVERILSLKERHGILDLDISGSDVEQKVEAALEAVGSAAHHAVEQDIAEQSVTLLKNDAALPLSAENKNIVILGRTALDHTPVSYAMDRLTANGFIDENTRIIDLISGETKGNENADRKIVIDRYYDTADGGKLVYSDELSKAIGEADAVICLSAVGAGLDLLQDDSLFMQGVDRALSEAKESGAKFILLSANLPVDTARFRSADAIVCAYLSAGYGIDPTAHTSGSENVGAFNANIPAALCAIFGDGGMPGRLPIQIPVLEKGEDGRWSYGEEILYERGYSAAGDAGNRMFRYRFAEADEAAELLTGNRAYYEGMNQNDLNFRLQKQDATLEEMEAFAAAQTRDFTEEEKAAIDDTMGFIEKTCRERGYVLPPTDDIVFAKTTMLEECDAGAYTHGTQIYLGQTLLEYALKEEPVYLQFFRQAAAHELFHCLTRSHPDFREAMYSILGFTVTETDYEFAPAIQEKILSNPDVEHHNSYASFDIGGQMLDCAVIFMTDSPFREPGDNFFDSGLTGLVPIDDLSTAYTSDNAADFWDVFGRNTEYVIDPEETLADNFSYTIIRGTDNSEYKTPEIIEKIDAYLKTPAEAKKDE